MSSSQNPNEVFKHWKYQYVTDQDGSQVRRYDDLVYTRWRAGSFVEFVNAIEGVTLFQADFESKPAGCYPDRPFATLYFATKYEFRWLAGGDGDYMWVRDPDGDRINKFVDMYNDTFHYALCDKNDTVKIDDITLSEFHVNNERHWVQNEYDFNKKIRQIDAEFGKHRTRLNDVEYTYLEQQLPRIVHMKEHIEQYGLPSAVNLDELLEKVRKFMLELRPPAKATDNPIEKKPSTWSAISKKWPFTPKPACHIQQMLDRLATLGRDESWRVL